MTDLPQATSPETARSRFEKKHDATDRVAREIIAREAASRLEQMERLRQARLVREAEAVAATPAEPVKAPAKRAPRRRPGA